MENDKLRIWIYWNRSYVRVTLHLDKPFRLYHSETTDEGYSYEAEEYVWDGETVYLERNSGGSDCDGPIHHFSDMVWDGKDTRTTDDGLVVPFWTQKKAWQRDVYAEVAGY